MGSSSVGSVIAERASARGNGMPSAANAARPAKTIITIAITDMYCTFIASLLVLVAGHSNSWTRAAQCDYCSCNLVAFGE